MKLILCNYVRSSIHKTLLHLSDSAQCRKSVYFRACALYLRFETRQGVNMKQEYSFIIHKYMGCFCEM